MCYVYKKDTYIIHSVSVIPCNAIKILYKLDDFYSLIECLMEQKEKKHVEIAKKIFDENNLDKAEKKLDVNMEKLAHWSWIQKVVDHKIMKDVLSSKFVHDMNIKISPYLKTIFLVVGRISVISGIIGIFSFLLGLSGLGYAFSFGFGIGLRVVLYVLIALAFSLLSLSCGIGMIRMKKRLPSLVVISFSVTVLELIVSLIPSGFMLSKYGSFGSSFLNLVLAFVLLVIVFKNKQLFDT